MANETGALRFVGTDGEVSFLDHASLDFSSDFSIGVWVHRDWDDARGSVLLSRVTWFSLCFTRDGELSLEIYGKCVSVGPYLPRDRAHLVAVSVEPDSVAGAIVFKWYLDGVLRKTESLGDGTVPSDVATAMYLGCYNSASNWFKGTICRLFITLDALTQTDIDTLWASGAGVDAAGAIDNLHGYWDCNGGSGDPIDEGGGGGAPKDGTRAGSTKPAWDSRLQSLYGSHGVWDLRNAGEYIPGRVKIGNIRWGGASNGNTLVLDDGDGSEFFTEKWADDPNTKDSFRGIAHPWPNNLTVDTIDGGVCKVYVE